MSNAFWFKLICNNLTKEVLPNKWHSHAMYSNILLYLIYLPAKSLV